MKTYTEDEYTEYEEIRRQMGLKEFEGEECSYTGHDNHTKPAIQINEIAVYLDDNGKCDWEVE